MASKAKYALVDAFLKLVEKESYEKITVTGLVEDCGISRQTFYYHFDDIDSMIEWAFMNETEKICAVQTDGKWTESAELYVDFLNRYDTLLRSAAKSDRFILFFNCLTESFHRYINTYLEKRSGKIKFDYEFLITAMASSFAGMVIAEIQKKESNYSELLNKITQGFKLFPNN